MYINVYNNFVTLFTNIIPMTAIKAKTKPQFIIIIINIIIIDI